MWRNNIMECLSFNTTDINALQSCVTFKFLFYEVIHIRVLLEC